MEGKLTFYDLLWFRRQKEVNRLSSFPFLINQVTQVTIHQFSQEWRERSHNANHREQNAEKCLQSVMTIFLATVSLK